MSTTNEKKRLSDVTNETAMTKPKKKANRNATAEGSWKKVLPYMEKTNKASVENFAKKLFEELWKTSGEKSATAVSAQFVEQVKKETEKKRGIAGTWVDKEEEVTLTIQDGLKRAACTVADDAQCSNFTLKSSVNADTLIYSSSTYQYWVDIPRQFRKGLKVHLRLTYYPDDDTIGGEMEISPVPKGFDYGRFEFTAERKQA